MLYLRIETRRILYKRCCILDITGLNKIDLLKAHILNVGCFYQKKNVGCCKFVIYFKLIGVDFLDV